MSEEINLSQPLRNPLKKRVLFIITQSEFGGAQRFIFETIRLLAKGEYELMLATGNDGDQALPRAVAELGVDTITLTSLRRNPHPVQDILAIREIQKVIRSFSPDTVFLNSSKAGFVGALAVRLMDETSRPKVIYRIGGWTFNDPWPAWKRQFFILLEKISARWKDIIILNNRADQEQAYRLGIRPRQKLALVYNGVDPYRIPFMDKHEARKKLLALIPHEIATKAGKLIGTLANLYPVKGLEILIEAAALDNDPSHIYLLMGEGMERKKLEQMVIDKGMTDRFFIIGRLAEGARYLPGLDVFVLSSHKEGFPWAVLEAMSAKIPVVATRVGSIPEMIEDGVNGFIVPPKDPIAISDKVQTLLNNELLANTMSVAGSQTVILKFSLEHMVSQIETLL